MGAGRAGDGDIIGFGVVGEPVNHHAWRAGVIIVFGDLESSLGCVELVSSSGCVELVSSSGCVELESSLDCGFEELKSSSCRFVELVRFVS